MTHDFLVGARPVHDGGMLKLGMRQLAVSEGILRNLLSDYENTKNPELAQEIAEECVFISQTIDMMMDLAKDSGRGCFVVSGALLRVSRYLIEVVGRAEEAVGSP